MSEQNAGAEASGGDTPVDEVAAIAAALKAEDAGAASKSETKSEDGDGDELEPKEDKDDGEEKAKKADDEGEDFSDPRSAKARFTTLTELKRQAEAGEAAAKEAATKALEQAAYMRGQLEALRGGGERPAAKAAETNPAPDAANKAKYPLGSDDPRYIADLAKHEIRIEQKADREAEAKQQSAQKEHEAKAAAFWKAVEVCAGNADTPNAAAALKGMPTALADLVAESPQAALIAEHLHANREEYNALIKHIGENGVMGAAGLAAVARKIGSLESSLPGAFAAKKVTKAAKPGEIIAGGGGSKTNPNIPVNLSQADFEAEVRRKYGTRAPF